jgi:glycosyltransferase involved in cell wall biosynthesis
MVGEAKGEIFILTHMLDRLPCGVGFYLESLLEEFKAFNLAERIRLVHDQSSGHPHYRTYRHTVVPMPKGPAREMRWAQWRLRRALHRMRPALVFCPIQTNPPAFGLAAPLVLTVWDFDPILWADPGWPWLRRRLIYGTILRRAIARSAAIIVPSESTRADLVRLFGPAVEGRKSRPIEVVPCAAGKQYRPRPDLGRPIPERYLLYVGSLVSRKNVATLIRAVAVMKRKGSPCRLVLVTPRAEFTASGIKALAQEENVEEMIEVRENMSDGELVALYTYCEAFVFPSLYEGFGLPVLEAMACGAPVITTRLSSLPEVAGDAARLVGGDDPEELARAIEEVVGNPTLRGRLSEAGLAQAARFSWRRTAEQTAAILERVLAFSAKPGRRMSETPRESRCES